MSHLGGDATVDRAAWGPPVMKTDWMMVGVSPQNFKTLHQHLYVFFLGRGKGGWFNTYQESMDVFFFFELYCHPRFPLGEAASSMAPRVPKSLGSRFNWEPAYD